MSADHGHRTNIRRRSTDLDVHEERPGGLDELLKLVLTGLSLGGRVEKVDSESLSG
jgi:hypothetical protein